jgi:hypothetical protein
VIFCQGDHEVQVFPILQVLFSLSRRSQQKTLALVIAAIAERAQASSVALVGH